MVFLPSDKKIWKFTQIFNFAEPDEKIIDQKKVHNL